MKIKGIYLVVFDDGIKIGMSNDCEARVRDYRKPWCKDVRSIIALKVPNPKIVEAMIKKRFSKQLKNTKYSSEFINDIKLLDQLKTYIFNIRTAKKGLKVTDNRNIGTDWQQIYPEIKEEPKSKDIPISASFNKDLITYKPLPVKVVYKNGIKFD